MNINLFSQNKGIGIWKNYEILKKIFFKFVHRYDIINCCINYEGVCRYIKRSCTKKKNTSQYRIISICQRTINIINCAPVGASLFTKQGRKENKKMCICFNIKDTRAKWIQSILKTMFEFMLLQVT